LQEDNTTKEDGQEVTEIINYSDYRKTGNFMFPHEITRNTGDQTMTMKITEVKVNEGVTAADFK
jgi:zinc protease